MSGKKMNQIEVELREVKGRRATLTARQTVAWAKAHPKSALHSRFEWNNTKAGDRYRLWQAQQIIKLVIVGDAEVPRYVSLSIDGKRGDGYRDVEQVIDDRVLRARLVDQAFKEFWAVRNRYANLLEFAGVVKAIDELAERSELKKAA